MSVLSFRRTNSVLPLHRLTALYAQVVTGLEACHHLQSKEKEMEHRPGDLCSLQRRQECLPYYLPCDGPSLFRRDIFREIAMRCSGKSHLAGAIGNEGKAFRTIKFAVYRYVALEHVGHPHFSA